MANRGAGGRSVVLRSRPCLLLGLGSIAVAGWSLAVGGIGWDTRGDTIAALITRSIPSSATLEQAYGAVPATSEFYGVLPQQLADVLHLLTTGSTTPLGPDDPTTYLYQGAANLLLAVLAVRRSRSRSGSRFVRCSPGRSRGR